MSKTVMSASPTTRRCRMACRSSCRRRVSSPMRDELVARDAPIGVMWPNDRRVAELEPWLGRSGADRAGVSEIPRRPRLQPGAPVARALRFSRRVARHRRRAARPVSVSAARRLRLLRGEEAGRRAAFAEAAARYSVFYQPSADGRAAGVTPPVATWRRPCRGGPRSGISFVHDTCCCSHCARRDGRRRRPKTRRSWRQGSDLACRTKRRDG